MLHCDGRLWRLGSGRAPTEEALEPIRLPAALGKVHAALAWGPGKLLLATDAGLRVLEEKTGKLAEPPFAAPKGKVESLCRDGRGRAWLAGGGVWMVDARGRIHSLEKVSLISGSALVVGADGEHDDGVAVSLGRRGVVFLRVTSANVAKPGKPCVEWQGGRVGACQRVSR